MLVGPIERLRIRGYRQTAAHVPGCLPPTQPARHAGRFHVVGDPWPLYAALDRGTMWAEWSRAAAGRVPPNEDARVVCTLEFDLRVIDLRSPATRDALGVTVDQLTAPWAPEAPNPACLRVARAAIELGAEGFVVPSAASPGGWNIAVLPAAFDRVSVVRRRGEAPAPPDGGPGG
jgi:RES domain-containing protein